MVMLGKISVCVWPQHGITYTVTSVFSHSFGTNRAWKPICKSQKSRCSLSLGVNVRAECCELKSLWLQSKVKEGKRCQNCKIKEETNTFLAFFFGHLLFKHLLFLCVCSALQPLNPSPCPTQLLWPCLARFSICSIPGFIYGHLLFLSSVKE